MGAPAPHMRRDVDGDVGGAECSACRISDTFRERRTAKANCLRLPHRTPAALSVACCVPCVRARALARTRPALTRVRHPRVGGGSAARACRYTHTHTHATDLTQYGEGRASPKAFLTHHVANISTTIQTADAHTVLTAATNNAQRLSHGLA